MQTSYFKLYKRQVLLNIQSHIFPLPSGGYNCELFLKEHSKQFSPQLGINCDCHMYLCFLLAFLLMLFQTITKSTLKYVHNNYTLSVSNGFPLPKEQTPNFNTMTTNLNLLH